jgi:phage-related protein
LRRLEPQEATLRISQAARDYVCTVGDVIFSDTTAGFGTFSIKFVCSEPFGYNTNPTVLLTNVSNTSASSAQTITAIDGSYKAEPLIAVKVSAVSGGTGKYIKLMNTATGKYIKITRTWVAGDRLVVDVRNKTVQVNASDVDYTGVFPVFEVGDTSLTYEDDFTTSRTVLISMQYTKRYL